MTKAHTQVAAIAAMASLCSTSAGTAAFSFSWSPTHHVSLARGTRPLMAILDKSQGGTSDQVGPFFVDSTEKEWAVNSGSISQVSNDSFQRARLTEQLRLSFKDQARDVVKSNTQQTSNKSDYTEALSLLANDVLQPILDPEIEKDVPNRSILGAAINGSFITVLVFLLIGAPLVTTLLSALSSGLIAAYVSITRGKGGDALRKVGEYTMTVTDSAVGMFQEFEATAKVERASKAMETLGRVALVDGENRDQSTAIDSVVGAVEEVHKAEAEFEAKQLELKAAAMKRKQALVDASQIIDNVEKVKLQAETNEATTVRDSKKETNSAIEEMLDDKSLEEEQMWLEEQNKLANERLLARIQEEKRLSEEEMLKRNPVDYAAAAKLAYKSSQHKEDFESFLSKYLVSTSSMIAQKHKERVIATQMEVERKRLEEKEALQMEAMAKAQAEEEDAVKRDAERIMREEEISTRLLEEESNLKEQQMLENGSDELNQQDWDASVQLANELSGFDQGFRSDKTDDILKVELGDLTQDEEELLGKAAREAVRKYEEEMQMKRKSKEAIQSSWNEISVSDGVMDDQGDGVVDYSQMTVAELKDILRGKGLKVSGKKGDLIARLMSS